MANEDINVVIKELENAIRKGEEILKQLKGEDYEEKSLENKITEIIQKLGISANMGGYFYIRFAVINVIETPELLKALTKRLYPKIAKEYNTTPSRVEKSIRHAIKKALQGNNIDEFNKIFPYVTSEKPKITNSQFISTIADIIQLNTL